MKSVLAPPDGASLDAGQLAAIGQYAVNVVDFRDPDATMTRFVNYDLTVLAGNSLPAPVPPASTQPDDVRKISDPAVDVPLVQWGMEYNPIAISEVLGYQFTSRKPTGAVPEVVVPRLFVELVNTLTENHGRTGAGTASDLNLQGWGFIITQDDPQRNRRNLLCDRTAELGYGPVAKYNDPEVVRSPRRLGNGCGESNRVAVADTSGGVGPPRPNDQGDRPRQHHSGCHY